MKQKGTKACVWNRLEWNSVSGITEWEETAPGFDVLLELFSGEDESLQEAQEKVCSGGVRQRQKRLV